MQGSIGEGGHVQFIGGAEIEQAMALSLDPDKLYRLLRPYVDQAISLIESEIRERVPQGGSKDGLRKAITHNVFLNPDGMYGSVFIQPDSDAAKYAVFVEYGRGPGKMPPVDSLIPWCTTHYAAAAKTLQGIHHARGDVKGARVLSKHIKKSETRDKAVLQFAWALAKHIAKHGTKAQHFFERGWTAGYPEAERIIMAGIDAALESMSNG